MSVIEQIDVEAESAKARWGTQDHPSVIPSISHDPVLLAAVYGIPTEQDAKDMCEGAADVGELTWAHILIEEVAEVIGAAGDPDAMRAELVQVGAMAALWIDSIDRNGQ